MHVNSVMILVLSTHVELASATAGGARIGKRVNLCWSDTEIVILSPNRASPFKIHSPPEDDLGIFLHSGRVSNTK